MQLCKLIDRLIIERDPGVSSGKQFLNETLLFAIC